MSDLAKLWAKWTAYQKVIDFELAKAEVEAMLKKHKL